PYTAKARRHEKQRLEARHQRLHARADFPVSTKPRFRRCVHTFIGHRRRMSLRLKSSCMAARERRLQDQAVTVRTTPRKAGPARPMKVRDNTFDLHKTGVER